MVGFSFMTNKQMQIYVIIQLCVMWRHLSGHNKHLGCSFPRSGVIERSIWKDVFAFITYLEP